MRFEFKPSFDRTIKNFKGEEKEEIKKVAIDMIDILRAWRKHGFYNRRYYN